MKKRIKITAYCLLLSAFCLLPTAYAGEYAFDFLELGVGARECAMGKASTSMPSTGFSPFWNPAGVANMEFVFAFMHTSPFGLANLNYVGLIIPAGRKFAIGLSFIRMGVSDILRFGEDEGDPAEGKFGVTQIVTSASFGIERGAFLIGSNLKYLKSRVDTLVGSGIGIDIGAIYRKRGFSFGINIKDPFTSMIVYTSGNRDILRREIRGGVSYIFNFTKGSLLFSYDIHSKYTITHHIGMEIGLLDHLFIRLGMDDRSLVGGGGVRIGRFFADYSFWSHTLGPTHRISGGVRI
ncbi:hypothetical protein LR066_00265 [candidate division WOR-3 bacterium]|nr:hypothetical protein [candidate division WOR-3 bacterium]